MIQYVYNSIELNIQRMIIFIQKHRFRQYTKKKKREERRGEMCVGAGEHVDNSKSFGVFNIFESMFKISCIFLIC